MLKLNLLLLLLYITQIASLEEAKKRPIRFDPIKIYEIKKQSIQSSNG